MICRVWHGWTSSANANAYEELLNSKIFPGIFAKEIPGFERIELLRRELGDEVEFVTIMWFTSMQSVRAFAGDDYEVAYIPAAARRVLARYDERSQHYEVRAQRPTG